MSSAIKKRRGSPRQMSRSDSQQTPVKYFESRSHQNTPVNPVLDPIVEQPEKEDRSSIIAREKCNITPYLLMIALTTHAFFEGLAVGINTKKARVFDLVLIVAMHKGAEALALGISLSKNFADDADTQVNMMILGFAGAAPVGIICGMGLSRVSELLNICVACLAAGTFAYIASVDIIVAEFSVKKDKWSKFFSFILGAAIITLFSYYQQSVLAFLNRLFM